MNHEIKEHWEMIDACGDPLMKWRRTTERMKVDGGWIYRTGTTHDNEGGIATACSEALSFVPDVKPPSTKR